MLKNKNCNTKQIYFVTIFNTNLTCIRLYRKNCLTGIDFYETLGKLFCLVFQQFRTAMNGSKTKNLL